MAAKKAAKKAAPPAKGSGKRPMKPIKEWTQDEMRGRSARKMTQKELENALVKKYGVPTFEPMTVQQAVSSFQDVVSESNLWNYPGIKQAARKLAERGHEASAEAYYKKEREQRMAKLRQKAAKKKTK